VKLTSLTGFGVSLLCLKLVVDGFDVDAYLSENKI
jgi:hypothetical protein